MINIIGQVAGKGIEMVGIGLLFGARAVAMVTRGVFFVGGKNVDMVETIRDMKSAREIDGEIRLLENQSAVTMPLGEEVPLATEQDKIARVFRLVRLALEYSTRAYNEKMLPIEQIVLVDRQAIIMANAIEQYLRKNGDVQLKKEYCGRAKSLAQASSLFMKYHRSGNELVLREAVQMIEEASDGAVYNEMDF